MLADGEHMVLVGAHVPIGREEHAQVLEAYFAGCRAVRYTDVQKAALQVPGMERSMAMRDTQHRGFPSYASNNDSNCMVVR